LARGFHVTRRAVALFVLVLVLAVSYFNSLRVYFQQEQQIQAAKLEIAERTEAIASMEDELVRWQDPAYVKAQARTRLGWVMPGEIGYRVIGPGGLPIGAEVTMESSGSVPPGEEPPTWYQGMWGSVEAADSPVPA
jgi:cell division protein FtsB